MTARLHHVFVMTEPGAPVADRLIRRGFVEGSANTHPGQGTANRRFFFLDMALELIYFVDEEEARSGPGRIIRSLDRYQSPSGSPFGLVFRGEDDTDVASFPGFPYQPVYFDTGQYFVVGDNADSLVEPTCVLMPRNLPSRPPQSLSPAPFETVSGVRVSIPAASASACLDWANRIDRVTVVPDQPHLMEIDFGACQSGEVLDVRPELPLLMRW